MKPTRFAELIRHDDDLRQAWDEFVKLRAMLGMHVRRDSRGPARALALTRSVTHTPWLYMGGYVDNRAQSDVSECKYWLCAVS